MRLLLSLVVCLVGLLPVVAAAQTPPARFSNERLTAEFDGRGLTVLTDRAHHSEFRFRRDHFSVAVDGQTFSSEQLPAPAVEADAERVRYRYVVGPYQIEAVYQLQPGWGFLSKQLFIQGPAGSRFRVDRVELFRAELETAPLDAYVRSDPNERLQTRDYGAFLRFAGTAPQALPAAPAARPARTPGGEPGLLAAAQNPFLVLQREAGSFSLSYQPDMEWNSQWGTFASDRGLLAPYLLTGRRVPASITPEWKLHAAPASAWMDDAEIAVFTECIRAFLLYRPEQPLDIFVGWCVNDYQIDISTAEGRDEYKRVIDRAAELGARYVLFAPTNSAISRRAGSADDWSWENLLWLGLGQKIRRNEWNPKTDAVPASVQQMLDYARSKHVKLVAYVYPVLPFSQNPEWLVPGRNGRQNASLGVRSLQDWLIETLVAFYKKTGIGGYSFDHTFLTYSGTSRYAQWWGWRRVMEELRRAIPDIVIDGRQAYQHYGPWSWLAGSYPHPTSTDEQPESFIPFPDLHLDRVSADRTRYTNWRYRNLEFAPSEIMPGFITHQTPRSDDSGDMPQTKGGDTYLTRFRARDWDHLGWRYSLISSIATAGWNNVLNMIPARDPDEYKHFSEGDTRWFRGWIEWTARNREYLRHTRTILSPPAIGRVDGTSAIVGGHGFLFLFNPNGRRLNADFNLNESIGLTRAAPTEVRRFLLKELYPIEGRLVGRGETGVWNFGDRLSIPMDGASALVLELLPAPDATTDPVLFNAPGRARLQGSELMLDGVKDEAGTYQNLLVWLPAGTGVKRVQVNGRPAGFSQYRDYVSLAPRFEGAAFRHMQQVGEYSRDFTGGAFAVTFTVPERVFRQLAERRKTWPIPWIAEDYRTTWLAPERLLLFVQIAEPDDAMDVKMRIDGQTVELKKAYSSIRVHKASFVGFYADVSKLQPGRQYRVELDLPALLPGQFQGLFFENVETEYATAIVPETE